MRVCWAFKTDCHYVSVDAFWLALFFFTIIKERTVDKCFLKGINIDLLNLIIVFSHQSRSNRTMDHVPTNSEYKNVLLSFKKFMFRGVNKTRYAVCQVYWPKNNLVTSKPKVRGEKKILLSRIFAMPGITEYQI